MSGKKLLAALLGVALVAGALAPAVASAQQETWQQAHQAFQQGNWPQAEDLFREVTSEHNTWGWGFMMLGLTLANRGKLDEAVDNLQTAKELVETDEERFQVNHNLGQIFLRLDRYDEAVAAEDDALQYAQNATNQGQVAWGKAQAYYAQENWSAAITALETALETKSGDAAVHSRLGRALYETGDLASAEEHLQQATQIDRDNRLGHYFLGVINLEQRDYQAAVRSAEAAVQADPQDPNIRNLLGRAYLGAERFQEAEQAFRVVLQDQPNDGSSRYNLGQAYQFQERYAEAVAEYQQALSYLPAGSEVRAKCLYDLGFSYEKAGNYQDALQAFQDSAEISSTAQINEAIERVQERIRREKSGGGV